MMIGGEAFISSLRKHEALCFGMAEGGTGDWWVVIGDEFSAGEALFE